MKAVPIPKDKMRKGKHRKQGELTDQQIRQEIKTEREVRFAKESKSKKKKSKK